MFPLSVVAAAALWLVHSLKNLNIITFFIYLCTALYRKFETYIRINETVRPRSQALDFFGPQMALA